MNIMVPGVAMKSTKELLGGRIRELRKGCGLSQEQLSEMIDVDPQYISRIELGKRAPSLDVLEGIANALQVDIRDLFDYRHESDNRYMAEQIAEMINSVEDAEQRKLILRITKAVKKAVLNNV